MKKKYQEKHLSTHKITRKVPCRRAILYLEIDEGLEAISSDLKTSVKEIGKFPVNAFGKVAAISSPIISD